MNTCIKDKLFLVFEEAKKTITSPNLLEIVNRDFVYSCVNMNADVIICGINPSFRKEKTDHETYSFEHLAEDRYYKKIHEFIENYKGDYKFTYIDMFYQRHTEQSELKNFLGNPEGLKFICNQLIITQEIVEQIKPKFIIVFNRMAANFWGRNNKKNIENVWLGYKFEKTLNEEIFKICGFEDTENRVNHQLKSTNLEGTYIYFSRFIGRLSKVEKEKIKVDLVNLLKP
jgi:hypothetical protein